MNIEKIIKNKKILLLLLILNFIGIILSFYTYIGDISFYFYTNKFYVIPFFVVSFWLYLLAFLVILYVYLGKKVPVFLGGLAFIYCFVYGIGAFLFYPLFMIFVRGFTLYHGWNVIAHGFVGIQSILFLYMIKKPEKYNLFYIISIFLLKDIMDLFSDGFLYFVKFDFPYKIKLIIIFMIVLLQIFSIYLLLAKTSQKT